MDYLKKYYEKLQIIKIEKPNKYRIILSGLACIICGFFLIFFNMFTLAMNYIHSGFYYFWKGPIAVFYDSRDENNAVQGFIFINAILFYLPMLAMIVYFMFNCSNYIFYIKIPSLSVFSNIKNMKIIFFIMQMLFHILIFLLIPLLIFYVNFNNTLTNLWCSFELIPKITSDLFSERFTGYLAIFYYLIGFVSFFIFVYLIIHLGFKLLINYFKTLKLKKHENENLES